MDLDEGVRVEFGGESEELQESFQTLGSSFLSHFTLEKVVHPGRLERPTN